MSNHLGQQQICLQSWSPLRAAASSQSEMVSALLFGETCTVLLVKGEWLQIRCNHDHYVGWVPQNYLSDFSAFKQISWEIATHFHGLLRSNTGAEIAISPGSRIPKNHSLEIAGVEYRYHFDTPILSPEVFLNTPYLWGGRCLWGIDCSGLVQVYGQVLGIAMPRDAHQQAHCGEKRMWFQRCAGDLAYFSNSDGKVTHVGILVSEDKILHAHGKVRIDNLTPKGIENCQTEQLSHTLCDIRTWK